MLNNLYEWRKGVTQSKEGRKGKSNNKYMVLFKLVCACPFFNSPLSHWP